MKKVAYFGRLYPILSLISILVILGEGLFTGNNEFFAFGASKSFEEDQDSCPYTVQEGDTLSEIASRLTGESSHYEDIMKFNGLPSDRIYPGDVLNIPNDLLLEEYQCEVKPTPTPVAIPTHTPTPIPIPTVTPSPIPTITPKPTLTPPPKDSERKIRTEIEGIVFEDSNNNGRYDPGELGVPEIEVVLIREVLTVRSDENGKVFFREIDPGEQAVGLDETSLPDGYRLTTDSTVLVRLSEGDRGYVTFGVQSDLASFVSIVYHDVDRNGRYDPDKEPGIPDVRIQFDDTISTTNTDGQVILRQIPIGTHTVTLHEQSLPEEYQLATEASFSFSLNPGDVKRLEFGVSLRP